MANYFKVIIKIFLQDETSYNIAFEVKLENSQYLDNTLYRKD